MRFWAGLYPELQRADLEAGVDLMIKLAMKLLASKKARTDADQDGAGQGADQPN